MGPIDSPAEAVLYFGRSARVRAGFYTFGGVSEWFKEAVLKTVELNGSVGSNPTPSAMTRFA